MARAKQTATKDGVFGQSAHDFVEPKPTPNGYWVTGADITQKRHSLRVFIKCRDRDTLNAYIPNLHITFQPISSQDIPATPGSGSSEAEVDNSRKQPQPALDVESQSNDQEP